MFVLQNVCYIGFRDVADGEKFQMRRTVGCTRLPHLTPVSAARDHHGDKTRSIAGLWRHLTNQFKLYLIGL